MKSWPNRNFSFITVYPSRSMLKKVFIFINGSDIPDGNGAISVSFCLEWITIYKKEILNPNPKNPTKEIIFELSDIWKKTRQAPDCVAQRS